MDDKDTRAARSEGRVRFRTFSSRKRWKWIHQDSYDLIIKEMVEEQGTIDVLRGSCAQVELIIACIFHLFVGKKVEPKSRHDQSSGWRTHRALGTIGAKPLPR